MKRNFPQPSVVLGYASKNPVTIGWFGDLSIEFGNNQSYWRARAVSVFVGYWSALINAFLAVIPPTFHARVIRSHSQHTRLVSAQTLLSLKPSGEFFGTSLRRPYFLQAMHLPIWQVAGLLDLPAGVAAGAVTATTQLKRGLRWIRNRLWRQVF